MYVLGDPHFTLGFSFTVSSVSGPSVSLTVRSLRPTGSLEAAGVFQIPRSAEWAGTFCSACFVRLYGVIRYAVALQPSCSQVVGRACDITVSQPNH